MSTDLKELCSFLGSEGIARAKALERAVFLGEKPEASVAGAESRGLGGTGGLPDKRGSLLQRLQQWWGFDSHT